MHVASAFACRACACARACLRASMCACLRVCVRAYVRRFGRGGRASTQSAPSLARPRWTARQRNSMQRNCKAQRGRAGSAGGGHPPRAGRKCSAWCQPRVLCEKSVLSPSECTLALRVRALWPNAHCVDEHPRPHPLHPPAMVDGMSAAPGWARTPSRRPGQLHPPRRIGWIDTGGEPLAVYVSDVHK